MEKDFVDSVKCEFYEKQVSKIIETISKESISEELDACLDSCSNEMLIVESTIDELSSPETCVDETGIEDCSLEIFDGELEEEEMQSDKIISVAEAEAESTMEPLMTEDDITLAGM